MLKPPCALLGVPTHGLPGAPCAVHRTPSRANCTPNRANPPCTVPCAHTSCACPSAHGGVRYPTTWCPAHPCAVQTVRAPCKIRTPGWAPCTPMSEHKGLHDVGKTAHISEESHCATRCLLFPRRYPGRIPPRVNRGDQRSVTHPLCPECDRVCQDARDRRVIARAGGGTRVT